MHAVELGSGGLGWVLHCEERHELYIKVTIEEGRVFVLSFHTSDHHKSS